MTQYYDTYDGRSACGCMGPMYDEPYCPCRMSQLGLPMSEAHVAANKEAREALNDLSTFFEKNRNKKEEK